MRNNCQDNGGGKRPFPNEAVTDAVKNVDETRARLNLAGLGLAAPMLSARAGNAAREAARTAADPRASKEEIAARFATHERVAGDLVLLHKETARAQVTPAAPKDAKNAVLYGRVVDGEKPVGRARIVAEAPGARLDHVCADEAGHYALEVPGDVEVIFAVARATGPIVHRDRCPTKLAPGQRRYREFDLGSGEAPCDPPGYDEEPPKAVAPKPEKASRTAASKKKAD